MSIFYFNIWIGGSHCSEVFLVLRFDIILENLETYLKENTVCNLNYSFCF